MHYGFRLFQQQKVPLRDPSISRMPRATVVAVPFHAGLRVISMADFDAHPLLTTDTVDRIRLFARPATDLPCSSLPHPFPTVRRAQDAKDTLAQRCHLQSQ
jgi:hypothetical protein